MLDAYLVLRKLTVCNIRVEPKKIRAEYVVEQFSGNKAQYELIYSYSRPYFHHQCPEDVNLASMMAVQVALNYGLFCQSIEFDGLFDTTDKAFLKKMLENTSREILTNKLLIDNEFILPDYKPLSVPQQKVYTQAKLVFSNTRFSHLTLTKENVQPDKDSYAILSSGGKDSLLTYGIIKEFGKPHPIFINEAGRHWFTAFNSYKYFSANEPNTEKPWCNSDRVFNWMLKQLPFIRKDYASIRADIYPVRLWTVAVFLFGTLPIVRKRNIGNILIGNEYDTTIREKKDGIANFAGLFDQSTYFDAALTQYFKAKGWAIKQFSLLRSMSELLIMKMLSNRYPELQVNQVSCHAARKEGEKMRPCGKCEKCRRIIGMLMALDGDPRKCGYTDEQIQDGLTALEKKSVKQIGSDASHLYYLLTEKGLINRTPHTEKLACRHSEITKLRFDAERSNLADLPEAVREPLFSRLQLYADGAVKRVGRQWQEIVIDQDFLFNIPYKG